MAHVYVDSNAAGSGTGADWANAYTTLAAALTAKAAGDNFWVAHDHAETQASAMTMTAPGTAVSPNTIMCVNKAGTVPPVSADLRTTATISTTGNNAMTINGFAYIYGIIFSCGDGASSPILSLLNTTGFLHLKSCTLRNPGTASFATPFRINNSSSALRLKTILENVKFEFGATSNMITVQNGDLIWRNTPSAIAGTPPAGLLVDGSVAAFGGTTLLEGVDLSAITSGTLVGALISARRTIFVDCKFGGATITSTPANQAAGDVLVVRSDSAGTNYRHEKYTYMASQVVETTIVRTGGASDGTTPLAWKIVSTANAEWVTPFESLPMAVWLDTTAAVTLTVYGIAASLPTQDDIWIEARYLGEAGSPLGSVATSGKADFLAAAANLDADTSVWGGSTTPFKMSVTFTPAQKGFVTVVVKVGGASKTIYIDPKIVVS